MSKNLTVEEILKMYFKMAWGRYHKVKHGRRLLWEMIDNLVSAMESLSPEVKRFMENSVQENHPQSFLGKQENARPKISV